MSYGDDTVSTGKSNSSAKHVVVYQSTLKKVKNLNANNNNALAMAA